MPASVEAELEGDWPAVAAGVEQIDAAATQFHNLTRQRQAYAVAIGLSGKKRGKNFLGHIPGNYRAIIAHIHHHTVVGRNHCLHMYAPVGFPMACTAFFTMFINTCLIRLGSAYIIKSLGHILYEKSTLAGTIPSPSTCLNISTK